MPDADTHAIEQAIEVLNRIHAADPTVLPDLIAYRVPCNETLADDPTVQVGKAGDHWEVGLRTSAGRQETDAMTMTPSPCRTAVSCMAASPLCAHAARHQQRPESVIVKHGWRLIEKRVMAAR